MKFHSRKILLLFLSVFFAISSIAQDVRSVDPKTMPESDVKKIEEAIRNAGLSPTEAANMARQRGASEQQIRDMQQRLQQSIANRDTIMQTQKTDSLQRQKGDQLSERKVQVKDTLRVFGSSLFNNENLTFEPSINIQTPKNYEIGIGDQIIINIWGNSQNNYQLTVNKSGQILIPDVGPIYIAGMTFENAETKIKQRLTEIYADMGSDNPQTFAQINMGRLRSINVNIVGEVTAPGTYTLPVTATAFNALYLSGGPNEIGSFRNINIIRDDEIFKTIDIYKFLIDADVAENVRLKDEDIILIPPTEKQVAVSGEFKRKGLFEVKEDERLNDVIRFAGGFTSDAYWTNLKIYRKNIGGKSIIDVPFHEAESALILNGDSIFSGQTVKIFKNRVTISGAVFRPGEYEWKENMTLKDLIFKADSLKGNAFLNRAIITRLNSDSTRRTLSFDLNPILSGENTILLNPEDSVQIKSLLDLKQTPYISVTGEVLEPGDFHFAENTTLADAIFMAGGFTEAADSSFIEVSRRLSYEEAAELSDEMVHIFTFDLSRDLKFNEGDANFTLKPFDRVSVRRAPAFRENASVMVRGEVKYAGIFAIQNKHQRISDLVEMAGGLTPQSFLDGATFSRVSEELGSEFIAIDLNKILQNPGGNEDLLLRDGDILEIPEQMQTVKITGSVQNPFSITYQEGKSLKYYIDKSGGFSSDALKRKVYVRYPNGATSSTKSFIVKNYPEVLPGSQIVVPAKPEREGITTQTWLSIASTFSSIAVALAAVLR
ncbi:SLBB domain-containing protein [Tangfeifania diversioriginum]|nr:SLBB domain-containing protein [Tangfeifania diversioriginum]